MNKGNEFKREWVFNPDVLVLWYFDSDGRQMTEIDVEEFDRPISMLDWMAHLLEKTWAHEEPGTMLGLMEAFNYVFGGLEGIRSCSASGWAAKLRGIKKKGWRFFPEPTFDTKGPDEDPKAFSSIRADVLGKLVEEHEQVWVQVSLERCRKAGMLK